MAATHPPTPRSPQVDPLLNAVYACCYGAVLAFVVVLLAPILVVGCVVGGLTRLHRAGLLVALASATGATLALRVQAATPDSTLAAYLSAQSDAGRFLAARLHGAPLALAPWRPWLAGVWVPSLLLGSLLGPLGALAAFPRSRSRASQEGKPGRNAEERAAGLGGGNATSDTAVLPVASAPEALYALAHRRDAKRVCLAGPHFTVGAVTMVHGPSGEGKSRYLAEVVRAITRGEPVFGWPTQATAAVWVTEESLVVWRDKGALVIRDGEDAWPWWRRWLRRHYPRRYPPSAWPLSLPESGLEPSAQTYPLLLRHVERVVRRTGAKLVILDTLMAVCPQAVKDNEIAKVFIRQNAGFAQRCRVAVVLVHHDNNDGLPLGAKMLKGAVDYTHHVHRLEDATEQDRRRMVTFGKRYEPFPPDPLVYRMNDAGRLEACAGDEPAAGGAGDTGDAEDTEDTALWAGALEPGSNRGSNAVPMAPAARVPQEERTPEQRVWEVVQTMCAAEGHATIPQIMLVTGLPKTTTWKLLQRLARDGRVVCTKSGMKTAPDRWTLVAHQAPPAARPTPAGRAVAVC